MRQLILSCCLTILLATGALADELHTVRLAADFQSAKDALHEAIENAGLVISAAIPINQMLLRTAEALDKNASPFIAAETIQFCSARIAWGLIEEAPAQLALCPMSFTVFSQPGVAGSAIAWRSAGRDTPARIRGDDLMRDLVTEARALAAHGP